MSHQYDLLYPHKFDPLAPEDLIDISIPIIAFSGPIGCGKTTMSTEFRERHPDWVVINYADMLRAVVELVYGIPAEAQKDGKLKHMSFECFDGKRLRNVLQFLGTEAFRSVHQSTWINAFNRLVRAKAQEGVAGVVVEDCRFQNEATNLQFFQNGFVVYIHSQDAQDGLIAAAARHNHWTNRVRRALRLPAYSLHQSELEMVGMPARADYILKNDFTLGTEAGKVACDAALYTMLQQLGLHTPWFYKAEEFYNQGW